MFLCFNDKKGFTLVELLVAVGIIVVMTSIMLADYRGAGRKSALYFEAHKLAGNFRRAQNMALASVEYNGAVPAGGWGLYIVDAANYIIFADNGNKQYENSTLDPTYAAVALENGVTFSAGISASVVFFPPDPRTFINGVNGEGNSWDASATITLTGSAGSKNLLVNEVGLIDVQD